MPAASFQKTKDSFADHFQTANPGAVLRQHRIERKLTLSDVSKLTGLPVSTLSKVETGKMTLNYSKLLRLSQGLDLDIARLFVISGDATASTSVQPSFVQEIAGAVTGRRSLSRAMEGPSIRTVTYDYIYPAADLLRKTLNPMILDVQARSIDEFDGLMRHPGEEYAMVLEGQCEFHCDLYAPVVMDKGDSIYFDGVMGHAYVAIGDAPCRILCVCSANDEDLKSVLKPV